MEFLRKMIVKYDQSAKYYLGERDLNPLLGKELELEYSGICKCGGCGLEGKIKLYGDGFCGKCIKRLACCDLCIVKPELCHYDQGTCRQPEWGDQHCNRPHIIYLANTSGPKVGITRAENVPSRWLDQGATQALPVIKVDRRYHSGLVEKLLAEFVSDKTNWRIMLGGDNAPIDLYSQRDYLFDQAGEALDDLEEELGSFEFLDDEVVQNFSYPVLKYPETVKSLSFEKNKIIEGTLVGIKGQYLIFDKGVFNVRKHSGYGVIIRSNI